MILNFVYDASVGSAPVGFTATLNRVASFFQNTFLDSVTVNIAVGYGELRGQALDPTGLGSSISYFNNYSYSQIRSALAADANSADDASSIASLPLSNPSGGNYWMTTAQAKAVGLYGPSSQLDGYIGFSANPMFDYDNTNGVANGQYDFFGTVAHEISEIMGRQLLVGSSLGGGAAYGAMDLFHFSAPGVHSFVGSQAGYFSADNGVTNLNNFNTMSRGDYGDWAGSAGMDAFLAFTGSGVHGVSAADLTLMDVLGWDTIFSPPADTTPPTLLSTSPADNGTNVALASDLVLTFSENVIAGAGNLLIHKSSDGSIVASIAITDANQVTFSGSTVALNPASDFTPNTSYYVTLASGVITDLAGNAYAGISSASTFNFATHSANMTINGDGTNNLLVGTSANDLINGLGGDDTLVGGAGDDTLVGGAGNDTLDGGVGIDNAVFSGSRSAYAIVANANGSLTVSGPDGIDTLTNIEHLVFDNTAITIGSEPGKYAFWVNSATHDVRDWTLSAGAVGANADLGAPPSSWRVTATGDFNGDGTTDALWYDNASGGIRDWLLSGTGLSSNIHLGSVPSVWHVLATGDFNGDGTSDIIWQNASTGDTRDWIMANGIVSSNIVLGSPGLSWKIIATGDFTGDGTADMLWLNASTGEVREWTMANGTYSSAATLGTISSSWGVAATGDFNHDGTTDIIWRNMVTGDTRDWLMSGGAVSSNVVLGAPSPEWNIIAAGDFNQDGTDDLFWRNSITSDLREWQMQNGSLMTHIDLADPPPEWHAAVTPAVHSDFLGFL